MFGSLATGDIHEWSDLDLVVVGDSPLPFLSRTKEILSQFRPKVGMDILVYTPQEWEMLSRERQFVEREIMAKGKVVYDRTR